MRDSVLLTQRQQKCNSSEGVNALFNELDSFATPSPQRSPEASRVMAMLQQHDTTFFASLIREQDPSHHRLERAPRARASSPVTPQRGASRLATMATPKRQTHG